MDPELSHVLPDRSGSFRPIALLATEGWNNRSLVIGVDLVLVLLVVALWLGTAGW